MIVSVKYVGELTEPVPAQARVHLLPRVGEVVHLPGRVAPWRVLVVEHHGVHPDQSAIPYPSITVEACDDDR